MRRSREQRERCAPHSHNVCLITLRVSLCGAQVGTCGISRPGVGGGGGRRAHKKRLRDNVRARTHNNQRHLSLALSLASLRAQYAERAAQNNKEQNTHRRRRLLSVRESEENVQSEGNTAVEFIFTSRQRSGCSANIHSHRPVCMAGLKLGLQTNNLT